MVTLEEATQIAEKVVSRIHIPNGKFEVNSDWLKDVLHICLKIKTPDSNTYPKYDKLVKVGSIILITDIDFQMRGFEDWILYRCHTEYRKMMIHEADEMFRYNDEMVFNPHCEEKAMKNYLWEHEKDDLLVGNDACKAE